MKKNSKLKYIAMTSVSLFSLATVFVATFAWFTVARNVDTDGTGFVATQMDSIVEKVEFHKMSDDEYTYEKTATLTYTMDKSAAKGYTVEGDSVAIGQYSTHGKKQSLLVLYKLKQDADMNDYKFTLKATTTITDFSKTILGSSGSIKSTGNSLSNVIQFYGLSYSEGSSLPEDSTNTLYDFSSSKTAIEDSDLKFVTFENNTAKMEKTSLDVVSNSDTTKRITYVAVILTYNQEAVEQIYTKYIGNSVLSSGSISFSNDFKLVI
jgi:hypothetical protein